MTGRSGFPSLSLTCSRGESLAFEFDEEPVRLPTSWHSKKAYLHAVSTWHTSKRNAHQDQGVESNYSLEMFKQKKRIF